MPSLQHGTVEDPPFWVGDFGDCHVATWHRWPQAATLLWLLDFNQWPGIISPAATNSSATNPATKWPCDGWWTQRRACRSTQMLDMLDSAGRGGISRLGKRWCYDVLCVDGAMMFYVCKISICEFEDIWHQVISYDFEATTSARVRWWWILDMQYLKCERFWGAHWWGAQPVHGPLLDYRWNISWFGYVWIFGDLLDIQKSILIIIQFLNALVCCLFDVSKLDWWHQTVVRFLVTRDPSLHRREGLIEHDQNILKPIELCWGQEAEQKVGRLGPRLPLPREAAHWSMDPATCADCGDSCG